MSAAEILAELRERGVRVEPLPDGRLYLEPEDLLDADLIERVRGAKPELLRILASPPPSAPEPRPLPLDLARVEAAINRSPRSPFLNDLAIATIARAAIEAQRALAALPPAARPEALKRCHQTADRIIEAIEHSDYASAYEIARTLQTLPAELAQRSLQ